MFDINFQEKGQLLLHIRKFLLYPPYWSAPSNQIQIPLTWHSIKFDSVNQNQIPLSSGLYCFVLIPTFQNFVEGKYVMYVGKTNRTLRKRFGEYIEEQKGKSSKPRPKVFEMLNLYKGHLYFQFCSIPNLTHVDTNEEILLNTFVPFINRRIQVSNATDFRVFSSADIG